MENIADFPLTLTLSLGEREQRLESGGLLHVTCANPVAGILVGRKRILPLPAGEGRGEGGTGFQFDKADVMIIRAEI